MALVHLDLDRFTLINDTLGYGAGDEVLRIVAARLRTGTGDVDTFARLDGDDFALVLGDLGSADAAIRVAECLLAADAGQRCHLHCDPDHGQGFQSACHRRGHRNRSAARLPQKAGMSAIQGYLLSSRVAAEQIAALLEEPSLL